jgi:FSR family fosmidomycin resistance protein-like MFS transporter
MEEPRKGGLYLFFLSSTHFVIHVYTMLLPVLLLPLQEELGVSLVQISLLSSVPRLLNVFIYLPTGAISDKYPAQLFTISFVVTTIGAIMIPLSKSFPLLMLGFTLISIGSTLYHPPSLKMASEYDPEKMSLAMGIHNIGSSLGFAAGPILLGYMLNEYDWRYSYYIWAALTIITTILSYSYTKKNLKSADDISFNLNLTKGLYTLMTRGFLTIVAISTLVEIVFNILVTYLPAYFTIQLGMTYGLSSTISGLGPLTGLVGSILGGIIGVRFDKYKMGVTVLVSITALLIAFPNVTGFWFVILVYGLSRCLQAAFMPLMNSMLADNSDAERRSLAYSFNFVVVSLGMSISTTITSILIEVYNTSIIFLLSIAIIIPTILLIVLLQKKIQQGQNKPTD